MVKLYRLPPAATVAPGDIVPIDQGSSDTMPGTTRKATLSAVVEAAIGADPQVYRDLLQIGTGSGSVADETARAEAAEASLSLAVASARMWQTGVVSALGSGLVIEGGTLQTSGLLSATTNAEPDFTIVLLPDTQYMVRSYPDVWMAIPAWIAANRVSHNIQAVIGLGDVVNDAVQAFQFVNARAGWDVIDGIGIPHFISVGNHDYDSPNIHITRDFTIFPATFPLSFVSSKPWFGGSYGGTLENWWGRFAVGSFSFLVMVLECFPRTDVLAWAQGVLTAHPDDKVLVITHSYISLSGKRTRAQDQYGAYSYVTYSGGNDADQMWNSFVKLNPNIMLVASGHQFPTPTSAYMPDVSDGNTIVHQLLLNHQADANGGNGYIGLLKFRPSVGVIEHTGYSVTLDQIDPTNSYTFSIGTPRAPALTTAGPLMTTQPATVGELRTPGDIEALGAGNVWGRLEVGTRSADYIALRAQLEVNGATPTHVRLGRRFSLIGNTNFAITNNAYYDTNYRYDISGQIAVRLMLGSNGDLTYDTAAAGTKDNAIGWGNRLTLSTAGNMALSAVDLNHLHLAGRFSLIGSTNFALTNGSTYDPNPGVYRYDGDVLASRVLIGSDGHLEFANSGTAGTSGNPVVWGVRFQVTPPGTGVFDSSDNNHMKLNGRFWFSGINDSSRTNGAYWDNTGSAWRFGDAWLATRTVLAADGSWKFQTSGTAGTKDAAITWQTPLTVDPTGLTIAAALAVTTAAPASGTAAGVKGQITTDAGSIYACTATNVWKQAALLPVGGAGSGFAAGDRLYWSGTAWVNGREPYVISAYSPGTQTSASQVLFAHRFARAVNFAANWAANGEGDVSFVETTAAAAASTVIALQKCASASDPTVGGNWTTIGTATIAAGGHAATLATSGGAALAIAQGDRMRGVGPATADTAAANFMFTFAADR